MFSAWIDQASILVSDGLFLDTSSIPVSVEDQFLDTFLDRCLDASRHLHLLRFIEGLFKLPRAIQPLFLSISLSIALSFLSQTISSHSNLDPQGFFKLFQDFLHLVSILSLILHAFHVLKPRFWSFSKLMSYC